MSYFCNFLVEICKTLQRDGQDIKIQVSIRMTKFRFWIKYTVFIENENEVLKNSDFCYTWSNDHIQYMVLISERSNEYFMRYDILKLYPIGITFFCVISIQHNVNPTGYDLKMPYLLEY